MAHTGSATWPKREGSRKPQSGFGGFAAGIGRLINRLKQFRRIATRCGKRGANYLAMAMLGTVLLWLWTPFAETP